MTPVAGIVSGEGVPLLDNDVTCSPPWAWDNLVPRTICYGVRGLPRTSLGGDDKIKNFAANTDEVIVGGLKKSLGTALIG